jgi:hypothetical protein
MCRGLGAGIVLISPKGVGGFLVAKTRVPHEGPKDIECRGCMREIKRSMKHDDGRLDTPESTLILPKFSALMVR